jgi:hypothetical protein
LLLPSQMFLLVLITHFLHILDPIMHRSHYQVIFLILMVLRFVFLAISRSFRCLWSLVAFVKLLLTFGEFLLASCCAFDVAGGDYMLAGEVGFGFDDWELEIASFVEI